MGLPASLVPSGTLTKKVQFINDFDARGQAVWCAIEIHFNAGGGQGTETLYYPGSVLGEKYAQAVQDQLWPVFGKDRGVKEGWYQQDKSKGTLHFLKATHCPSIIVKPESIEHHKDIIQKRKEGCAAIAEALYAVAHGNI
jgi:N-acetylmuramoyl-L-alanine amidase